MKGIFLLLFFAGIAAAAQAPYVCNVPGCESFTPAQIEVIAQHCQETSSWECDCVCYGEQSVPQAPAQTQPAVEEVSVLNPFIYFEAENLEFDSLHRNSIIEIKPKGQQVITFRPVAIEYSGAWPPTSYEQLDKCFTLTQGNLAGGGYAVSLGYDPLCQTCGLNYWLRVNFSVGAQALAKKTALLRFSIPCKADVTLVTVGSKMDQTTSWRGKTFTQAVKSYVESVLSSKTARYVELDSPDTQRSFGAPNSNDFAAATQAASMASPKDSRKLVPLVRGILADTKSKYLIILGGVGVVPMPYRPDVPTETADGKYYESADGRVPSDDPYSQPKNGVAPSVIVSRFPTVIKSPKAPPQPIIAMIEAAVNSREIKLSQVVLAGDACGSPGNCFIRPLVDDLSDRLFGKECGQAAACKLAPTFCRYYQDQEVLCEDSDDCRAYRDAAGRCVAGAPAECRRLGGVGAKITKTAACDTNGSAADVSGAAVVAFLAHGSGKSFAAQDKKPGTTDVARQYVMLETDQFYDLISKNELLVGKPAFFSNSCYNGAIDRNEAGQTVNHEDDSIVLAAARVGSRAIIGRARNSYDADDASYFDLIESFLEKHDATLGKRFLEVKQSGYKGGGLAARSTLADYEGKTDKLSTAVDDLQKAVDEYNNTRPTIFQMKKSYSKKYPHCFGTSVGTDDTRACILLQLYQKLEEKKAELSELAQERDAFLALASTHEFTNIESLVLYGSPLQTSAG
ncbi:MAG: C25 family cysteine peptidase [Candidatus Micrarchaeota archaeon]